MTVHCPPPQVDNPASLKTCARVVRTYSGWELILNVLSLNRRASELIWMREHAGPVRSNGREIGARTGGTYQHGYMLCTPRAFCLLAADQQTETPGASAAGWSRSCEIPELAIRVLS